MFNFFGRKSYLDWLKKSDTCKKKIDLGALVKKSLRTLDIGKKNWNKLVMLLYRSKFCVVYFNIAKLENRKF